MHNRLFLAFILCPFPLFAQQVDSAGSLASVVLDDVSFSLAGVGHYVTSPFRFSSADWVKAGGVMAATGAIMMVDEPITKGIDAAGRDSYNGDWWDAPTLYGDFAGAGVLGALIYSAGLAAGSKELRITGRVVLESLASAGAVALSLRYLTGRSRPFTGDGPWRFQPPGTTHEHQSFPSGHGTAAFALSTALAERIGTTWSRLLFYSMGTLGAAARVRNNQHWTSDVAMGAVLGITAGFSAVGREEEKTPGHPPSGSRLKIIPNGSGLTLVYTLF